MKLIVGLGNPGKKYEKTRHNVGFIAISNLRSQSSEYSDWKLNKKFTAEVAEGKINGKKIILLRPQTFMNRSGIAVRAAAAFYKIKPPDIFVIYDDIDLPLGKIRIRKDGSSGGHLGVQSIINLLGTQNFVRFRIGIGPEKRWKGFDAAKFVLQKFSKKEEKNINEAIKKIIDAIRVALDEGVEKAMTKFNKI